MGHFVSLALRANSRRCRHPCIDKPSAVTDIGLQISETFRELKIEQQLAPTREALSSAFNAGSTNFLKAVDGIKGRWPVQRSSSSHSARSESSASTGSAVVVASVPEAKTEISSSDIDASGSQGSTSTPASAIPTSPPRPPSVVAAQVTSDAKAALGAWGTGIGSFFSSRASRFSLSRNNNLSASSPVAPAPVKDEDNHKDTSEDKSPKVENDSATPAVTDSSGETVVTAGEHQGGDAAPGA